jgi:cell fate (sporulation/competence/biofilm development) regulator YlbF (YheA/YmcA/DUF963 family)
VQEIIEAARRLGKLIAESSRAKELAAAAAAVRNNPEAQGLLRDHGRQLAHMQRLEAQVKPVEVQDKHKLAELEAKLAGHVQIKALMKAQADFAEMMHLVNDAIQSQGAARPAADEAMGES